MIKGGKGLTTEAGTHVPLIANWPGTIPPGRTNDNLIDFSDFLPTFMDVAGIPSGDNFGSDGLSFYPQLIEEADTVRPWIFGHYDARWENHPLRRYVQDQSWKLYDDGTFYNIAEDPDENTPIPDDDLTEDLRTRKQQFQAVLDRLQF